MSTLLVGNAYNEHLVGDLDAFDRAERRAAGNIALRLAWLLKPGDVLILPQEADPVFMRYLLDLTGTAAESVTVLVPPPGRYGHDVLTGDRLLDPGFQQRLQAVAAVNGIDEVLPYSFDSTVATLTRRLGLDESTPGFGFLDAGGASLLNKKSVFRAIAAGADVTTAEGIATTSRATAEDFTARMLVVGKSVIVKQDIHAGGFGNDILTPEPGVKPIGAPRTVVLNESAAITRHFDRYWPDYTNAGRNTVVIEHYIPDSVALGAEVRIFDEDITVHHIGEMRMAPIFDGIAIPGHLATPAQQQAYIAAMLDLCAPIKSMGYRGYINIDGILTPSGDVMLTEFNGRLGGTTHLHRIGEIFFGPDYATDHLLVTRNHLKVPSSAEAISRLAAGDLAFDRVGGRGVVITCDHVSQCGAVEYCVIAGDADDAARMEKAVADLFPQPHQT